MSDSNGFSVKISVECFGPDGERWSNTENHWFGVKDEHTMNLLANGCIDALVKFSMQMNEVKYGDKQSLK